MVASSPQSIFQTCWQRQSKLIMILIVGQSRKRQEGLVANDSRRDSSQQQKADFASRDQIDLHHICSIV